MKRSQSKDLLKQRIAKFIKFPKSVCKTDKGKPVVPELKSLKKKNVKATDRKLPEERVYPRYNLPKYMRLFYTRDTMRKVAPEPFIMNDPHTIVDVDEQFYTIIEGRPLRQFTDCKVYMTNIRDITLFRANASYMLDQILQFESAFQYEMDEYNKIAVFYASVKDSFVQFAKESYAKAKEVQRRALEKARELDKMVDILDGYSFEYVKLRNQVSSTIATYETLSRYKKFLNNVSPTWWEHRNDDHCTLASRICTRFAEDIASASTTSMQFYKQSALQLQQLRPTLYFQEPEDLLMTFDDITTQCGNYLQAELIVDKALRSVLRHRDVLKKNILWECDTVQSTVDRFRDVVAYYEQIASEYKAAFDKLIEREFEKLFASYDATKLFTCVQYVHTKIFMSAEDPKDDLANLMRGIERTYIEVTKSLDTLDQEAVKEATNKLFSEDIMIMNRAHKAQRILKECNILTKALYTSFEPPRKCTIGKKNQT